MASITQTINGTWRVQLEHRGQREYKTFKTKSLASQYAIQREAEFQKGQITSASEAERTTLDTVLARYEKRVSAYKRGHGDASALNAIRRSLGNTRLIALSTAAISDHRDERLDEGRAPATVVKEINLLRSVIDYAIRDMGIHLPANVARLVKSPRVNNSRDRVFLRGEEDFLFEHMENPPLNAICKLALETACRLGELLALSWENIDLTRRTARIPLTKTDEPRTIPLTAEAVRILRRHAPKRRKGQALSGRVFVNWARSDSFTKTFRRAVECAKTEYLLQMKAARKSALPEMLADLRFHDFRHIATSRLAKKVPNVIELSRITGHSDLKMLSRYYHITAEELAAKI